MTPGTCSKHAQHAREMTFSLPALLALCLIVLPGSLHAKKDPTPAKKTADGKSGAQNPNRDDDDDEAPGGYYEGEDAPMGGTVNPDAVGARPKENSEPDVLSDEGPKSPIWMEMAGEGVNLWEQDAVGYGQADFRAGRRVSQAYRCDVYGLLQFDRDQRGFPWDNRVAAGGGLRYAPRHPDWSVFIEALGGEYLMSATRGGFPSLYDTAYVPSDTGGLGHAVAGTPTGFFLQYRAGMDQTWQWGRPSAPPAGFGMPFTFWGGLNSALVFSLLERRETMIDYDGSRRLDAWYGDWALRTCGEAGWVVVNGPLGYLSSYVTGMLHLNTRGDWWDNVAAGGPGLGYFPFAGVDLSVRAEYLVGSYFGKARRDEPRDYPRALNTLALRAELRHALGI